MKISIYIALFIASIAALIVSAMNPKASIDAYGRIESAISGPETAFWPDNH